MKGGSYTVVFTSSVSAKLKQWKVKEGTLVSAGRIVFLYEVASGGKQEILKFKCHEVGTVRKLLAKEGEIIRPGFAVLELEECNHPTVMKDMCAECGADLRKNDNITPNASVPMVHSIPELKVSEEQAQTIGKADETRLLSDRKLVLLVDLDQTIIHTTNDNIPPNLKDVYHFQLYGPMSPWYHTRIRPWTQKFLEEISSCYELHICTFGARHYAHTIAMFLDPDGKYFSQRILSRDECFDANSKTANLKALFPCGDNLVCIIDDREDVWNFAPNLIHVKPYHFFQHTGDINAPPGLTKKENDEIAGFDFSKLDSETKEKKEQKPVEVLGETTTDKDTDDEDTKSKNTPKNVSQHDLQRVSCDLELSEEDSDDESSKTVSVKKVQSSEIEGNDNKEEIKQEKGEKKEDLMENKIEEQVTDEEITSVVESFSKPVLIKDTLVHKDDKEDELKTASGAENLNDKLDEGETKMEQSSGVNETEESVNSEGEGIDKTEVVDKSDVGEEKKFPDLEKPDDELIEVEDTDDYLLYLTDILKKIHQSFYGLYDSLEDKKKIPDMKKVIPGVKSDVLKNCHLVFSGIVPSHVQLDHSRAYSVAISLGATVTNDLTPTTTHLVAARPGTAKVNSSRRQKGVVIVTPLWLWNCAERWERLDERLYPLGRSGVTNRHPPAHCGSPEHVSGGTTPRHETSAEYTPILRNRTPSGRFIDTINPLLTFSSEDIKIMDQEVEDMFNDDDDDDDSEADQEAKRTIVQPCKKVDEDTSSSSSSTYSLSGATHPHGWREKNFKSRKRAAETTTCTESDIEEESPSVKFRRGEPLPSDIELGDSQDTDRSNDPPDDIDDGDWNMMGAALEREFLSGN